MRPAKATKEMDAGEIERHAKPEARETAAFDPGELQDLVAQMNDQAGVAPDDDLAIPVVAAGTNPANPVVDPAALLASLTAAGSSTQITPPGVDPALARSAALSPREPTPPPARTARGSRKAPQLPTMPATRAWMPWLLGALVGVAGAAAYLLR